MFDINNYVFYSMGLFIIRWLNNDVRCIHCANDVNFVMKIIIILCCVWAIIRKFRNKNLFNKHSLVSEFLIYLKIRRKKISHWFKRVLIKMVKRRYNQGSYSYCLFYSALRVSVSVYQLGTESVRSICIFVFWRRIIRIFTDCNMQIENIHNEGKGIICTYKGSPHTWVVLNFTQKVMQGQLNFARM